MFCYAKFFNQPLNNWNTSNVTDMNYMFARAIKFGNQDVTPPNSEDGNPPSLKGDISGWNTSNVTNMSFMFGSAMSFNGDITKWDTSSVTKMNYMFQNATSFNRDINTSLTGKYIFFSKDGTLLLPESKYYFYYSWDTGSVKNMQSMFRDAESFNGDISRWNTNQVTNMSYMFKNAILFDKDINRSLEDENDPFSNKFWDTINVKNMEGMFTGATSFNGDISRWDVRKVRYMAEMFYDAKKFNGDITNWDISADTSNLFNTNYTPPPVV
jgi:surface protein